MPRRPFKDAFQSTHPLRGATLPPHFSNHSQRDFNPRTPCGVRRIAGPWRSISTLFQSTHPLRGATMANDYKALWYNISIHAPLAGCDIMGFLILLFLLNFNPRTPCGVRQISTTKWSYTNVFQSTHPLRGATKGRRPRPAARRNFNPRTPCGVRLTYRVFAPVLLVHFNPRTPCGVRHLGLVSKIITTKISIHAPLAGCDAPGFAGLF